MRDRLHDTEVRTRTDDDCGSGVAKAARRRLEVPHGDGLVDAMGHVVSPDEEHRGVRPGHGVEDVGDLEVEVLGDGTDHRPVGEPHGAPSEGGDPARQDGADGLLAVCGAEARRAAVTEDYQLEGPAGSGAVDPVVRRRRLDDLPDRAPGQDGLRLDEPVAEDPEGADAGHAEATAVGGCLRDPPRSPRPSHRPPHPVFCCRPTHRTRRHQCPRYVGRLIGL